MGRRPGHHGRVQRACEAASGYYIAQFGRDAVGAIDDVVEPEDWRVWQQPAIEPAAERLKATAARIDLRILKKHPRGPKKPVPPRIRFKGTPHVSTQKLLDGQVEEDG